MNTAQNVSVEMLLDLLEEIYSRGYQYVTITVKDESTILMQPMAADSKDDTTAGALPDDLTSLI